MKVLLGCIYNYALFTALAFYYCTVQYFVVICLFSSIVVNVLVDPFRASGAGVFPKQLVRFGWSSSNQHQHRAASPTLSVTHRDPLAYSTIFVISARTSCRTKKIRDFYQSKISEMICFLVLRLNSLQRIY